MKLAERHPRPSALEYTLKEEVVLLFAKLFDGDRSMHRYFFYDNEDGILSFNSFLTQYQQAKMWKIEDKGAFVQVMSTLSQRNIEIYANKPLQSEAGAQEIDAVLRQHGIAPRVIVHRGHNTDADRTIEQIPVAAVLVFLGSCGGYSQLEAILAWCRRDDEVPYVAWRYTLEEEHSKDKAVSPGPFTVRVLTIAPEEMSKVRVVYPALVEGMRS